MHLQSTTFMTFSPGGKTKTIMETVARHCQCRSFSVNLLPHQDPLRRQFESEELLVTGFPVYSGRMPSPLVKRLAYIKGNRSPAVVIATYGNHFYGDALLEMADFLSSRGFVVIGGAAFIGRHAVFPDIAEDRPDASDLKRASAFAQALEAKINRLDHPDNGAVLLPGHHPYQKAKRFPAIPTSTKDCRICGVCAINCPVQAIPRDAPDKTDRDKCIACTTCIVHCPYHCRQFKKRDLFLIHKKAVKTTRVILSPETWL